MGRKKTETPTTQVSVRIPQAMTHDIDVLVKNGFFKDRSDFVYEAVKEHLETTRKKLAGRIVELEMPIPTDVKADARSRTAGRRP